MDFTAAAWIWLYIGAFLMLAEIASPGFVIFFFGLGAATVAVCKWAFPSLGLASQLAIFSIASIFYLVVLRRYMKKLFMGDLENSPGLSSEYVGRVGKVIETIRPEVPGRIELGEVEWKATAGERIDVGVEVKVVAQDNLTMRVEAIA
ncbi:MAG: NfeD family protein [Kiritimatiellae bacterium]|nr:NfeD family protein [Kiritimatiellia bacterium]